MHLHIYKIYKNYFTKCLNLISRDIRRINIGIKNFFFTKYLTKK